MNKEYILKTFNKKKDRNWTQLYWAIDLHDTCLKASYDNSIDPEFFPLAKEVLQRISNREDCCLIMYTCSYPAEIGQYRKFFKDNGINFKYVNCNPEADNTPYGFFESKFYFQFLLDDKSGFDANNDWKNIMEALDELEK